MDASQLRDETVRDRVRAAQEFLDPRMPLSSNSPLCAVIKTNPPQLIPGNETTDQTSS